MRVGDWRVRVLALVAAVSQFVSVPTYQVTLSESVLWSGSWIVAVKVADGSPRWSDWLSSSICTVGGMLMGPVSRRQFVEPPARRVTKRSLVRSLATA